MGGQMPHRYVTPVHMTGGLLKTSFPHGVGRLLVLFRGKGVVAAGLEGLAEMGVAPVGDVASGDVGQGLADGFAAAAADDSAEGEDHLRHAVGTVEVL